MKHCTTEEEKVRAIYTWITHNIRYDRRAFLSFTYPPSDPKTVLKRRKAVCAGYARLFEELCEQAGIEAYGIVGYSKGAFYRLGQKFYRGKHTWSAVRVDNEWQLMDLTWGSSRWVFKK
ncbi:MAG: transglutaminase domain-containing protein, partial [Bacteroidota bacterium]